RERGSGLMLRDNEVLKKMIATGEERMSKLASQLLQNETFMGALQKTMSAALDVKATAERAAHTALSAMNIPTSDDVRKLEGKIEELEKVFEGLSRKIAELQKKEAAARSAVAFTSKAALIVFCSAPMNVSFCSSCEASLLMRSSPVAIIFLSTSLSRSISPLPRSRARNLMTCRTMSSQVDAPGAGH